MDKFLPMLSMAVAGALGTLARYGLSGLAHGWWGSGFAWGTLAVNLAGCLLLGALMQAGSSTTLVSPAVRMAVGIGFCGAFTTFSTFGYETMKYMEDGAVHLAAANIAANVVLGLACVWLGMALVKELMGGVA